MFPFFVNGGQTIRSIYNFLYDDYDDNIIKLREAYILVRIFKVVKKNENTSDEDNVKSKEDNLKNEIAEYTNSQNAISDIDLKSIDTIQIQIEKYLREFGILYSRKAGDLGTGDKDYKIRISMQRMAQLLYSKKGYPDRASNQKTRLFNDYYNEIFKQDREILETCKTLIETSIYIVDAYKSYDDYKYYDQKLFYIVFIISFTDLEINDAINRLEELLINYKPESETSEARKLIQKRFKDYIISELDIKV